MHPRIWTAAVAVSVALTALVLTASADDDAVRIPKNIAAAVNQMADSVAKDRRIDKEADAFFMDHKDALKQTMWVFKPRDKDGTGGYGVGPKLGVYQPDGIEAFLIDQLSKKPRMALDVNESAADLNRLANVTLAVSDILHQYKPKKPIDDTDLRLWTNYTENMKRAAVDLKVAVKQKDAPAVKKAFEAINSSCIRCHNVFRDGIIVPKKTREAVNKMADAIAAGNEVDKEADAFFKDNNNDLQRTMWVFKPRGTDGKGGFGVGPKPGVYTPDGIEGFILAALNPRRKSLTDQQLKDSAKDILRLADVTLAMAEITGKFVPEERVGQKRPKDWNAANYDMKQAAQALKTAVKAEKKDDVRKAFFLLAASCNRCHVLCRDAAEEASFLIPAQTWNDLNTMADAVAKGEKIDKDADAFAKDHKGDLMKTKWVFKARMKYGKGGFGVGPIPGIYKPDEIEGYIIKQSSLLAQPLTENQLKEGAVDLTRLADVMIVMAEVTQRYKPKAIVIGGPVIVNPADWTASANDMKQAAIDLKAAVKANKPNNVKTAFTKLDASCVKCHLLFR